MLYVSILTKYFDLYMKGLDHVIAASLLAMVGSFVLGTIIAVFRISSVRVLNVAGVAYVEVIRNIPLLLVVYGFYLLPPALISIARAIVDFLITTILLMMPVMFTLRRWKLPLGAVTFFFAFESILMGILDGLRDFQTILILLICGIMGDLLFQIIKDIAHRRCRFHVSLLLADRYVDENNERHLPVSAESDIRNPIDDQYQQRAGKHRFFWVVRQYVFCCYRFDAAHLILLFACRVFVCQV